MATRTIRFPERAGPRSIGENRVGTRDEPRLTGLCCLSTLRRYLGSLDRVGRVVRVVGFVNCAPGFTRPSEVLHGFADLMIELFGENGRHVRSAIGVAELYADIPVEVEALFKEA